MQEIQYNDGRLTKAIKAMSARLETIKAEGGTITRRIKVGRNEKCPCGSGLKFKKCCVHKVQIYD